MHDHTLNGPGIYAITNNTNGKIYVGSAVNIRRRWQAHYYSLRRSSHGNPHLQAAWTKYGSGAFTLDVLEYLEEPEIDRLLSREQYWIDTLRAADPRYGYNICRNAGSPLGRLHTEETKRRIGNAIRGRRHTEETKRRIGEAHRGREFTEESRKRMSDAQGKIAYLVTDPSGHEHRITNLAPYCRENGLNRSSMNQVARGNTPRSQGLAV